MTPPFTIARLTVVAAFVFVLTFALGVAAVSALQEESDNTVGSNVAVVIVPLDGGPMVTKGPRRLLQDPGVRATAAVAPALATELLAAGGLPRRQHDDLRIAVSNPADTGATDQLGTDLDARFGDPAVARAAVARTAAVVAAETPYRDLSWSAVAQARFLAKLGRRCLIAQPEVVLDAMFAAGRRQPWGLGTVRGRRARPVFSGASEPAGQGWVTRQGGFVSIRGVEVAVAIVAEAPDRRSGEAAVTRAAEWIVEEAEVSVTGGSPCA